MEKTKAIAEKSVMAFVFFRPEIQLVYFNRENIISHSFHLLGTFQFI